MNKFIAAVLLAFLLVVPNPVLSKDHDGESLWSELCIAVWAKNRANAAAGGTIIDLDYDTMELFAQAVHKLPPLYMPPIRYLLAFDRAKIAFVMEQGRGKDKVAYWVGLWNFETCDGAVITLPISVYRYIFKIMGQII